MSWLSLLAAVALVWAWSASTLAAGTIRPAVAYTDGAKFDSSFNEAVFRNGVVRFEATYGIDVTEVNPGHASEFEPALRALAESGHSPIVVVGYAYAEALTRVAADYPGLKFTILDTVVEAPNVQSLTFAQHEGSFLVGALAAMKVEPPVLGFVGGQDLPLIRSFACGYAQGAYAVNPDSRVLVSMIGDSAAAWSNPQRAAELAQAQFDDGAQVVFAAAGGSGVGAYRAAHEAGRLAIAVDSNQNYLHLGTVLTSMVKRVGVAAYGSWAAAAEGDWQPGVQQLGLAEDGVDWVVDIFNRQLIPYRLEDRVNRLRQQIIAGEIEVADYTEAQQCPVPLER